MSSLQMIGMTRDRSRLEYGSSAHSDCRQLEPLKSTTYNAHKSTATHAALPQRYGVHHFDVNRSKIQSDRIVERVDKVA